MNKIHEGIISIWQRKSDLTCQRDRRLISCFQISGVGKKEKLVPKSRSTVRYRTKRLTICLTTYRLEMDTNKEIVSSSPRRLLTDSKQAAADKSLLDASTRSGFDEADGLRAKSNFNWLDVTCIVVSICSYLADLITDGFIAATYFHTEHYWYFGLTVAFVAIPAFTMSGLSTKWYIKVTNELSLTVIILKINFFTLFV